MKLLVRDRCGQGKTRGLLFFYRLHTYICVHFISFFIIKFLKEGGWGDVLYIFIKNEIGLELGCYFK